MAELNLIVCDNCGVEFTLTPEATAAMTQLVITQGGSRGHVYDLCPTCASGFAPQLPQRIEDWPRFVRKESVQGWLRQRNGNSDELSTPEKEEREARGDYDHVWRPTNHGDG